MLDLETRTAILRLHREGHGARRIARALCVSRNAVRKVVRSGRAEVPRMEGRETELDGELNRLRALHVECKGNQVRVHEKLADEGIEIAYSTLTAFCRRHLIGVEHREPVGRYKYAPGKKMQQNSTSSRQLRTSSSSATPAPARPASPRRSSSRL